MNLAPRHSIASGSGYQLSIEQLQAFVVTVQTGSFSAAARKLNKAQSSVSGLISNLEIETGCALFDRSKNRPALTKQGNALLQHAEAVVNRHHDLLARVNRLNEHSEENVHVMLDERVFRQMPLSTLLRDFQQHFPNTTLTITSTSRTTALEHLRHATGDIALIATDDVNVSHLQFKAIGQLQYGIVVSAQHPLARDPAKSAKHLSQYRQLLYAAPDEKSSANEASLSMSAAPFFSNQFTLLIDWLRQGFGWAELPLCAIKEELRSKQLIQLNDDHFGIPSLHSVDMVWCNEDEPGTAMTWLLSHLPSAGGAYLHMR